MDEQLKPCPFCGHVLSPTVSLKSPKYSKNLMVVCRECDAEGPTGKSVQGAIEKWNDRPAEDALRAELTQAREELERLKTANRWIPVDEKLPDELTGVYLTVSRIDYVSETEFHREDSSWHVGTRSITEFVTHWRELPAPPEAE